jgi:polysaccharide biosynthesis protein PslH
MTHRPTIKALMIAGRVPWPTDDGWKLRTFNVMNGLIQKGVEVHFVAFGSGSASDEQYRELRLLTSRLHVVPRKKSYALTDLLKGLVTSMPFSVLNYFEAGFQDRIDTLCREENFDFLLVEDIVLAEYAKSVAIPIKFLDMHNVESNLLLRYADRERSFPRQIYARITAAKLRKYEATAAEVFNRILVCSENDRDLLQEMPVQTPVVVVPNGIDPSLFEESQGRVAPGEIVFVGSMDYHANISGITHFVKEIFPRIVAEIPGVTLSIVGKNPGEQILALASGQIKVTGKVPDVRPFLSRAALVIVPLLVGGGTRLKILEAMAMGKAVISTSLGCEGITAVSGETIWLEDTPAGFAARVVSLLSLPDDAQTMGRKARDYVLEHYDWSNITQKIVTNYQEIAAG